MSRHETLSQITLVSLAHERDVYIEAGRRHNLYSKLDQLTHLDVKYIAAAWRSLK